MIALSNLMLTDSICLGDISTLEKAIMHADIVIGSRFVNEKKPKSMRI